MTVPTDLKKRLPSYTARRGRFDVLTVPPLRYLMIDGHGDPNTAPAYADALATLYPVAYALKFLSRNELGRDHVVMPLEALWWSEDMASFTSARDKSTWSWTAMILTPDWITGEHVATAIAAVRKKRGDGGAPALDRLRHESLDEGLSIVAHADDGRGAPAGRLVGQAGRERLAGQLADLEGTDETADVRRADLLGGQRIPVAQQAEERTRPLGLADGLVARTDGRVGAREPEVEQHTRHVEPRAAHEHRHRTPPVDLVDDRPGAPLVPLDARLVGHIELVQEVVRYAAPLGDRQLRGSDVHAPVELHRVGVDDLRRATARPEPLGQVQGQRGLAGARGTDQGDQHLSSTPRTQRRPSAAS